VTSTELRLEAIRTLKIAAESVRALGTLAVQRPIHNLRAAHIITIPEMLNLQAEWNGVSDHLDLFIGAVIRMHDEAIDDAWDDKVSRDMDPDPDGDRDYAGPCPACGNSLPLNAECRCSGCGNG
jgi:hypothetical protein